MRNGSLSPSQVYKICPRWLLPCIICQEDPAFLCGGKHCPEVFAPVILVLLEGQCHRLWQYELQRRSWFTFSWTFFSQFLDEMVWAEGNGQCCSRWSHITEIGLSPYPAIGSTCGVKHTIFMLWFAPRVKEGLQSKASCAPCRFVHHMLRGLASTWCWELSQPCVLRYYLCLLVSQAWSLTENPSPPIGSLCFLLERPL